MTVRLTMLVAATVVVGALIFSGCARQPDTVWDRVERLDSGQRARKEGCAVRTPPVVTPGQAAQDSLNRLQSGTYKGHPSMRYLEGRVETYLAEAVRAGGIPGLTAAVVYRNEIIYLGAFGVRRAGEDDQLTPDHVFHFASISKPFVATAMVQLAEDGKIGLDDPVTKHLPYFRMADERYGEITIRQMLNHTSGIPDVEDYEWDRPQFDEGAAERYVRSIADRELLFAPGSDRRYSNLAFDVLGDVIAKVSGVSFEEYIKSYIFLPLGMVRSSFIYTEIDEDLRTTGHVDRPARVSEVYPYNRRHAPSSTLNSSVAEMTRWILANLNRGELDGRRIVDEASHDALWISSTPVAEKPDVGLGWFLAEHGGAQIATHTGQDTGFSSSLIIAPDIGAGIVMVSNWDEATLYTFSIDILDEILIPHANSLD